MRSGAWQLPAAVLPELAAWLLRPPSPCREKACIVRGAIPPARRAMPPHEGQPSAFASDSDDAHESLGDAGIPGALLGQRHKLVAEVKTSMVGSFGKVHADVLRAEMKSLCYPVWNGACLGVYMHTGFGVCVMIFSFLLYYLKPLHHGNRKSNLTPLLILQRRSTARTARVMRRRVMVPQRELRGQRKARRELPVSNNV